MPPACCAKACMGRDLRIQQCQAVCRKPQHAPDLVTKHAEAPFLQRKGGGIGPHGGVLVGGAGLVMDLGLGSELR